MPGPHALVPLYRTCRATVVVVLAIFLGCLFTPTACLACLVGAEAQEQITGADDGDDEEEGRPDHLNGYLCPSVILPVPTNKTVAGSPGSGEEGAALWGTSLHVLFCTWLH